MFFKKIEERRIDVHIHLSGKESAGGQHFGDVFSGQDARVAFCLTSPVHIDEAFADVIPVGRIVENGGENEFVGTPDISEKTIYFGVAADEVQKINGCPAGEGKPVGPADHFKFVDREFPGSEEAIDQFFQAELAGDAPVDEVVAGHTGGGGLPLVFDGLAGDELDTLIFGDMAVDEFCGSEGEVLGGDDMMVLKPLIVA